MIIRYKANCSMFELMFSVKCQEVLRLHLKKKTPLYIYHVNTQR